jgi:peptide/nickel transport system ATP-binding protein
VTEPDRVSSSALLKARDLTVTFHTPDGPVRAVDRLDLDLAPGERLGLVGESGSGKSVLVRTLMGLYRRREAETSGTVRFNGTDILALSERRRRSIWGRDIAMIFQDPMNSLHPIIPVGDQIAEVLMVHRDMPKAQARVRAVELLDRVGMVQAPQRARSRAHELSGGMRQRVMIAMAMACEPKLLLADEPTTALDVTVQARILTLFDSLCAEFGIGLVLVSHDLEVVSRHTDRIAVMYAGQLVETGPVTDVYRRPSMRYTEALIAATPRWHRDCQVLPRPIPGQAPNLLDPMTGCRFAPRCAAATEQCTEAAPPFEPVEPGSEHRRACWHPVIHEARIS